jgi:hypothetical protein
VNTFGIIVIKAVFHNWYFNRERWKLYWQVQWLCLFATFAITYLGNEE